MEKEKVIEVIQNSKSTMDERELQIANRSFRIGQLALTGTMLLIMALRWIKGDLFSQELLMMLMAQVAASSLYQYFKIRDKTMFLYAGVLAIVAFVLTTINTLIYYGYF